MFLGFLAFLLALVLSPFLIGVGSSSSGSGTSPIVTTATATGGPLPFTINGKRAVMRAAPLSLHRGDVVRFDASALPVRVVRLECRGDVHPVGRTWPVPDLPAGEYAIEGNGFGVALRQRGHSAPCP